MRGIVRNVKEFRVRIQKCKDEGRVRNIKKVRNAREGLVR